MPRISLLAALSPLLIVAMSLLASNPDYEALGIVLGTLALIGAVTLILSVRPGGWPLTAGVILGLVLLVLPVVLLPSEWLAHKGVRAEVRITAVHTFQGKHGPTYTCDAQPVDGVPLPHAHLNNADCWDSPEVGATENLLVDPGGWFAPMPADTDFGGMNVGIGVLAGAVLLFELLVVLSRRSRLKQVAREEGTVR